MVERQRPQAVRRRLWSQSMKLSAIQSDSISSLGAKSRFDDALEERKT